MNYLALDLETTGLSPDKHAITQIACIPIINGVKKDPFMSCVKPHHGAVIDPYALEIQKKTHKQIMEYPEASIVIENLCSWLKSQDTMFGMLGQNISFDQRFLYSFFCRNMMRNEYLMFFRPKYHCTLALAKEVFKGKRNKPSSNKLGDLCSYFKINLTNAHDALADIEATYELYLNLRAMRPETPEEKLNLTYWQKRERYMHSRFCQLSPDGAFISNTALSSQEALRFIAEELYNSYGE